MKAGLRVFGVAALVLAGCTAVPSHSAPQTIQPIELNTSAVASEHPPPPGASPRDIVADFLNVSALEAGAQGSARDYLTRAARGRWQDSSVNVVDAISVGNFAPEHPVITVKARHIATVDDHGIYMPSLLGTGNGGTQNPYQYRVKKVGGEYRIDNLPDGLLMTLDQFSDEYRPHPLEFFDLSDRYLIPDLRYSPLRDVDLANWLITQLADGPRTELTPAVSAGELPNSANRGQLAVTLGGVTKIEVSGAAKLAGNVRDRLAAQISRTLLDVVGNGLLSITDGGRPVEIPASGNTQFVAAQFDNRAGPARPPPELYYLRSGRVVDDKGEDLAGAGVDGTRFLSSVAVADSPLDPNSLSVAGIVRGSGTSRLYVGTQQLRLTFADVQAPSLSRPAWAPGRAEVWIGAGRTLYRLTVSGVAARRHRVPLPSAANEAPIQAVRISPDGSRIALVLGVRGSTRLFEGPIVRSAHEVHIADTLMPISPQNVAITDVAWNDPLKLFAIGYLKGSLDAKFCETNVDGSGWSLSDMTGLPDGPQTLTATANALPWVSFNNTVWQQGTPLWTSPGPTGQTPGTDPVYLE